MKVVVFGSTGGTGRQVVGAALGKEHEVTAFARSPERLDFAHENLNIVRGDVLDLTSVERAIEGQDAVLCSIGTPASSKDSVRSEGTRNIIGAMEELGVSRLVCQSTLGFGDTRDMLPMHFKYIIVPLILRRAFTEHERQETIVKNSRVDWTIVRPGVLTDGERTGQYRHGFSKNDRSIKLKISRADVADFMLKQLDSDAYLNAIPGVSY